jgi:hypothetical protein
MELLVVLGGWQRAMRNLRQPVCETIFTGVYPEHAGHFFRTGSIKTFEDGMRMRGPDNNHVDLTVDSPVVTEPAVPCQKADIFPAANRLSDFFILHCPASRFNLFMALQLSPYASVWKESTP